ncbi:hypothetical protein Rsub_11972 [Raphidocelis subcapitata]|uniref:Uncharacterized protein n=1 Tax=Raphidocelis subcapitata TaxID=307507 RepID=A0A2V0PNM7_9CHLO|nr:hypothetical protein Rsub_11972 [Raphidocelis subcapitata]|eukprot:GBF99027.1 hypothetical protein Rsub_11972 [Raphidocelis subcapitata]
MQPAPRGAGLLQQTAALWWSGVWDALQLQRCVVFCVLDSSGVILSKAGKVLLVNGGVYLASVLWHEHVVGPATDWLLQTYAAPAFGPAAAATLRRALDALLHASWLLPVYVITLLVSCMWYQQMAVAAFEVKRQQQQIQQQQIQQPQDGAPDGGGGATVLATSPPLSPFAARALGLDARRASDAGGATGNSGSGGGGGSGAAAALEGVAQEAYRVVFFLIFSLEVLAISWLPLIGAVANVLFLSWLYAFYCFDYCWSLQGVPLPERLSFFERRWAFFAGFGLPCMLPTLLLPYHVGCALVNLLFPVFVLVACGSDPAGKHSCLGWDTASGRMPIFGMALRPTAAVIGALMRRLAARARR